MILEKKVTEMQFFLQNAQNLIFRSWKCLKTTRNSSKQTETPHS